MSTLPVKYEMYVQILNNVKSDREKQLYQLLLSSFQLYTPPVHAFRHFENIQKIKILNISDTS